MFQFQRSKEKSTRIEQNAEILKIIIYNPNSFGGNFNYIHELLLEIVNQKIVEEVILLLPKNSKLLLPLNSSKYLLADKVNTNNLIIRKLYFLLRSFVNPLKLFWLLIKTESSYLLWNDFDQMSAPLTSWLFKFLKKKHVFSVILHDPDRDSYLSSKFFSIYTMVKFMSIIDIAFYHEVLPQKIYYNRNIVEFVGIPHGIYPACKSNLYFKNSLKNELGNFNVLTIFGNIRHEKNYDQIIKILPHILNIKLIIAGALANSSIETGEYKKLAISLGVQDRIIWLEKYHEPEEVASIMECTDIGIMFYKETFKSQSGVLNVYAPYKKPIIVSNIESGLTEVVKKYNLGKIVDLHDEKMLISSIYELIHNSFDETGWWQYYEYASWKSSAKIICNSIDSKSKKFNEII
ncbi:MAG: glycosyltransferase [Ignavibacteriae bacterium]|nr:glycosyltransferase [Ignavibacteriota bacterium]MCB0752177.1 glycosyltransferase [Ignavibacteriota bacterium]